MKAIAIFGAFLGLTSVVMGAASDHVFSGLITADNAERLDVALRYHQFYAILIFCIGLYGYKEQPTPILKWGGYVFCAGTTIFCVSLYVSLFPVLDKVKYFTPAGGIFLMIGWLLCLIYTYRFSKSRI